MLDKIAVESMHEDADIFQSSILESRQAEHAAEVHAAEERARIQHRQKKVNTTQQYLVLRSRSINSGSVVPFACVPRLCPHGYMRESQGQNE